MTERRYTRDEIDAILGRAIEREHGSGELSHADLVAAAREVGIPADTLEAAAAEVLAEQQRKTEIVRIRHQQWRGFFRHLVPYLLVNGMLITLNLLTTRFPWAMFPAIGWGIGLFTHFMAVVSPNPQRLERLLEREHDRERRRQRRQRLREDVSRLEQDVGAGVTAVLHAAAKRIANGPANAPSGGAYKHWVVDTTGSEAGRQTDGSHNRGNAQNPEGTRIRTKL